MGGESTANEPRRERLIRMAHEAGREELARELEAVSAMPTKELLRAAVQPEDEVRYSHVQEMVWEELGARLDRLDEVLFQHEPRDL